MRRKEGGGGRTIWLRSVKTRERRTCLRSVKFSRRHSRCLLVLLFKPPQSRKRSHFPSVQLNFELTWFDLVRWWLDWCVLFNQKDQSKLVNFLGLHWVHKIIQHLHLKIRIWLYCKWVDNMNYCLLSRLEVLNFYHVYTDAYDHLIIPSMLVILPCLSNFMEFMFTKAWNDLLVFIP